MVADSPWRNRIVGHGMVAVDSLLANPANWRVHPKLQQDALAAAIQQVGYIRSVTINVTTQHMVDGHLRAQLADRDGVPELEAEFVELTEEEERIAIATLDPLGALAVADKDKLADLLTDLENSAPALLAGVSEVAGKMGVVGNVPARPEFDKLVDEFSDKRGLSPKDGNWFYIEYYGDDERFAEMSLALAPFLKGHSQHEVDRDLFAKMVHEYAERHVND